MTNKDPNSPSKSVSRMILVSLGSGCMTFVIASLAAFAGFMIDRSVGTELRWTLILLIGSMPISMVGAYLISRNAANRMKAEQAALKEAVERLNEQEQSEVAGEE